MFDSTMELITLVSSNSLIIFFICNLIIVTLLLTGSKLDSPSSANDHGTHVLQDINSIEKQKKEEEEEEEEEEEDQEGENVSLLQTINRIEKQVKEKEEALEYNDIEASSSSQQDTVQASINNDNNEGFVVVGSSNNNNNNNNNINDNDNANDDEDEDELRKRAEEFIEKINRRWKEEKFGNSQYLERQNLNSGFTRIPVM